MSSPEDGGSRFLRNIVIQSKVYKTPQPTRSPKLTPAKKNFVSTVDELSDRLVIAISVTSIADRIIDAIYYFIQVMGLFPPGCEPRRLPVMELSLSLFAHFCRVSLVIQSYSIVSFMYGIRRSSLLSISHWCLSPRLLMCSIFISASVFLKTLVPVVSNSGLCVLFYIWCKILEHSVG